MNIWFGRQEELKISKQIHIANNNDKRNENRNKRIRIYDV